MKANLANRPTVERLREMIHYDATTGRLLWKVTTGRAVAGNEAGTFDKSIGYRRVRIDGFFILGHHIVWALVHGEWPTQLDHRYGKENGDRVEDLRPSNQRQNLGNTGLPKNNTSGVKGIVWHKASGQWLAQIAINRKMKYLGIRRTIEEAAALYEAAAREHFGEFARTDNFRKPAPKPVVP